MAQPLEAGWITYCAPYEAIHRHNLQLVAAGTAAGELDAMLSRTTTSSI